MQESTLVISANGKSYNIDLYDDEPIQINKSIIDIREFNKRTSDFSRTIKIPATHANNNVFGNIFNMNSGVVNTTQVNYNPDFNPNFKVDAILSRNGIAQLYGYVQLTNIVMVDEVTTYYEIIIIGRTANLFQDLGDLMVNQVNLTQYDHVWNIDNVENSWTAPKGVGYVYPMIDYGNRSDGLNYFLEDYKTAVYIKTIVDAIFKDSGYRYESAFFNSDRFKSLIMPFNGTQLRISDNVITDRSFQANRLIDSSYLTTPDAVTSAVVPINNIDFDSTPAGYNTSTFQYTIQATGTYSFVAILNITLKNMSAGILNTGGGIPFYMLRNGVPIGNDEILKSLSLGSLSTVNGQSIIQTGNLLFTDGDVIETIFYLPTPNGTGLDFAITVNTNSTIYNVPSAIVGPLDTVSVSSTLPSSLKQADLLLYLINMFNLYIEVDKIDNRKLIIEPKEDFYTADLVDWTDKVDVSRSIEIKPIGAIEYKSYTYKFKEDKDKYNSLYQNTFAYPYGTRRFDIDNQFVKATQIIEVGISPTPLIQIYDRIIPQIVTTDTSGNIQNVGFNPRILIYGGQVPTGNAFTIKDETGLVRYYTEYPYCGHLDSTSTPTFDLNFGTPIQLFYKVLGSATQKYTSNNLVKVYHEKSILEITNKNSKLVTFSIHLNEVDLQNLSFRALYYIDLNYYRLYNIDYDSNSTEPAKVTFIKIVEVPFIPGGPITGNGGNNGDIPSDGGGGDTVLFQQAPYRDNNSFDTNANVVAFGKDNNFTGNNIINTGDANNIVADNATTINSSSNQITHKSVTLINTNDYTSENDDEVVINGLQYPLTLKITLTQSDLEGLYATPMTVVEADSNYLLQLVGAISVNVFNTAAYANNNIQIFDTVDLNLATIDKKLVNSGASAMMPATLIGSPLYMSNGFALRCDGDLAGGNGQIVIYLQYRKIRKYGN